MVAWEQIAAAVLAIVGDTVSDLDFAELVDKAAAAAGVARPAA
jgi:hypothetical protein